MFINANVVHDVRQRNACQYKGIIFPSYFLGFYTGSPANILVDDVVDCGQPALFLITKTEGWQENALSVLQRLTSLADDQTDMYAYEVLVLLSSFWLLLRQHMETRNLGKESRLQVRMRKILGYIRDHYAEEIHLDDLARSANISKSECFRYFRQSLGSTPFPYLMEFRLSKAAQLLETTYEPVGHIADRVGFHQMSHFGKYFKRKTGYSPQMDRSLKRGQ